MADEIEELAREIANSEAAEGDEDRWAHLSPRLHEDYRKMAIKLHALNYRRIPEGCVVVPKANIANAAHSLIGSLADCELYGWWDGAKLLEEVGNDLHAMIATTSPPKDGTA